MRSSGAFPQVAVRLNFEKSGMCWSGSYFLGLAWIDRDALVSFILHCEDQEDGGFSDKPGNQPDVFHWGPLLNTQPRLDVYPSILFSSVAFLNLLPLY